MTRTLLILVIAWLTPALSAAQQPPPEQAAPPAPAQGPTATPSPLEPRGYTYEAEGRRDPFVSLVQRGDDSAAPPPGSRPSGLEGLATSEVALRGTIRGRDGTWVAILQGVDRRSYLARPGDRLFDGTVRTVTEDSMVISQRVNDPLSLDTQRDVRKELRQTEEAR